ncbi:hypothetical protein SAMN04489844_1561 [Nocardioides exalbidus]|uniref:Uncharacterized protein n=1 Tax=Nocardioides exalbidus TaxID=402596 RepID=A0A1H4PAA7_9ACTN|nr:DUF6069 family protein [Nocardioides exalbidus]SEC04174.1 hypothetical protein SAMN04489844_1561 [Nocardioides exalbidus]
MTALSETRGDARSSSTVVRRGLTVVAAPVAAVAAWAVLTAVPGADLVVDPGAASAQTVGAVPVVVISVVAALAGWGVLALLERYAASRATRVWRAGAAVVLLVSLVPLLAPGTTDTGTRVSLAALHALVTGVVVLGMTRPARTH